MAFPVPIQLAENCRGRPSRRAWLERLPDAVLALEHRWSLRTGAPFADASGAWVAPATTEDGTSAVLKLAMPHMEGEHELDGLRFWNGDGTVRLLRADRGHAAMLLERCEPGTPLRALAEPDQDVVIAGLLRRLWRSPGTSHPFRPLSDMTALWAAETQAQEERWPDRGLVEAGLRLLADLAAGTADCVLLVTDLHAGNVLRAAREPWLVIDPKPFAGDPSYDATQHLLNCETRLRQDPDATIARFADLLGVEADRVRLWTFARAAAEPRDDWDDWRWALARRIAP